MRIRLVILVLIGLSLAPFLVSQIFVAQKNMRAAVATAEQSLRLSLVRTEALFSGVQDELENLSSTVALIDSLRHVSPELCGQTLRKIVDAHARVEAIALLTPQGTAYCASKPSGVGVSIAERQYFADSLRSPGIVWGDVQASKISGQIIIASARAVRFNDEVSFVVLVVLDVAALKTQTLEQFQLHVSRAALMNGPGDVLDSTVFDEGAPAFDDRRLMQARSIGTGVVEPDVRDGNASLIGIVKLPMTSGHILFATPIGQIYAEARREMIAAVALVCLETLLIAVFLLMALEVLILRSLRQIANFASRITLGHHQRVTIRSPLPDFAILSSALNTMIDKLESAGLTDMLTGLANRRALEAHLDHCDKAAGAEEANVSVAMIDIDHFKRFNDRFGHATGDSVLQMVGKTLKEFALSDGEIAARYGGEEFTLILTDASAENVARRLEVLRRMIEDLEIVHPDSPHAKVTISIGFSVARPGERAQDALERADLALYEAKKRGRNRVEGEVLWLPGAYGDARKRAEEVAS